MESRNKLTMCRLCLSENECFINLFEMNDWQGFVASEVISDLLQLKVSETDYYPHVVCSTCLTMLTDFKLFKECCQKSKVTYEKMFILSNGLVMHQPEMNIGEGGSGVELFEQDPLKEETSYPNIKPEELDIDSSVDGSDQPFEGTNTEASHGPISLKDEILSLNRNSQTQSLVQTGPYSTSLGSVDADSCTRTISTNDGSIFVKSKSTSICVEVEALSSGTMEGSEGALSPSGERVHTSTLYQQDVNIDKERGRDEQDRAGEGERQTCPEKGVIEERERFECYHCGNLLKTKVGLKRHMVLHGFGKSYDCIDCGKRFVSNADHMRHIRSHTGYKPYQCVECSKRFSENANLKIHMRLHAGTKPFKCSECGKRFTQKGSLYSHMRTHTGSKPYKCSECSKHFREMGTLMKHMRTHTGSKPYKCVECSKSFSQNGNLKKHMGTHTGSKPYKCAGCSKSYSKKYNLKQHMRKRICSIPYKCSECNQSFCDNGKLKTHMRIHTGYKPHTCAKCSKNFSDNSRLNRHMRIHTGTKPYKCSECGKCFSEIGTLNRHMRTHTDSKPYNCVECSKSFSQKGNLKIHMGIHTGSNPYKCVDCSKSFSQNGNLKKHMETHRL